MTQLMPPGSPPQSVPPRRQSCLHRKLTKEDLEQMEFAFHQLAEGRRTVGVRQVKVALRALGIKVKKADVIQLLRDHGFADTQIDPELDCATFKEVLSSKLAEEPASAEMRRVFQAFDLNNTGKITARELALIARQLQEDVDPREVHGMIAEFDLDGDAAINEAEFAVIMEGAEDD